jgi:hypothetical protein
MNELCLKKCLALIEQKLGWGLSADWLNQDFQLLSDQIFDETRVRLSITTLKRVWGKVNYDSAPSISTLNTLVLFIGFDNWSAFKQSQPNQLKESLIMPRQATKFLIGTVATLLLIGAIVGLMGFSKNSNPDPIDQALLDAVVFSSQPTSIGLPNSVVFNYDLAGIETKKAFIQQSWNERLTFEIDKDGKEATGIYYYPGYFKAKLIAKDQIVKQHDLHVKTNGWMGTIAEPKIPRYLYNEELNKTGSLKLSAETFEEMHELDIEKAKTVSFHYSNDLGEVYGDDFTFETRFKNTYRKSNGICQRTNILIHGSEGAFIVPFSISGCVSDLSIFLVGSSVDGKSNDLSAFGCDFSEWQTLRAEGNGKKIKIYVNDQFAKEIESPNELGKIVGFRYTFSGAGEVDYLKLSRNKKVFYEEDFLD